MQSPTPDLVLPVVASLRKILRGIAIHSKQLVKQHQLTNPQLIVLRELGSAPVQNLSELARRVKLSNATVTGIVDRLERRELVARRRSSTDRRHVRITITDEGLRSLETAPRPLQDHFIQQLENLPAFEQAQLLASLERVASMMNAETLDAAPLLSTHPLDADEASVLAAESGTMTASPAPPLNKNLEKYDMTALPESLEVIHLEQPADFPEWLNAKDLAEFLYHALKPYNDTREDVLAGINDALGAGNGGFVLLIHEDRVIKGALVMLKTGMKGYIPPQLILFVAVDPDCRGKGLGRWLMDNAISHCEGPVALHVEYDNPAKRLYERVGFKSKYAEMRYDR